MNGDIDIYTYTSSFKHKTETLKFFKTKCATRNFINDKRYIHQKNIVIINIYELSSRTYKGTKKQRTEN